MSLTVIKAGLLDSVQDTGRYGFQDCGINPGGAMDRFSAQLSNCLLGKRMNAPVFEIHYPAMKLQFNEAAVVSIAGADFSPAVNHQNIPLHRPVVLNRNAVLEFRKVVQGCRCYLSVLQDLDLLPWLNSYSTNLKAAAGGYMGRALQTGDSIGFERIERLSAYLLSGSSRLLPWHALPPVPTANNPIEVLPGKEWNWLAEKSKAEFLQGNFTVSNAADRMGYRLTGPGLELEEKKQLVSCGVSFGSIQLLPDGQLIVLMADHQTTGGYPVIANVISSHLTVLAQLHTNDRLTFNLTDMIGAEKKLLQQNVYLLSVQHASSYKVQSLFA